ncbi:hypothetical protein [Halostagnicola sp. A-GB9-2]|uniref:DUF7096 domain-containing protein n=1 Tax=Halostagnicola sp. A-GB9-2 TaxID=3048066 RepID=UPI0024BFF2CF|nr:hypothetical protein [Halostagnicola sp. A-GB9-2]MDJ1432506.1 hypothetical protein [Halostagnicola sp. A-GB9-2]
MTNAMPALLALLLVFSLPAMAVSAANPSAAGSHVDERYEATTVQSVEPTALDGTTNRLELTGETRTDTVDYSTTLGTELATADDELRSEYDRYTILDHEFDEATSDEQISMIRSAREYVQNRTNELEDRSHTAAAAHANNEISSEQFIQKLIRNHNEANSLADTIDEIDDKEDQILGYSIDLTEDEHRLDMQQGSVRSLADGTTQETATGQTIEIETSENGYQLETIVDDTYVVETTRFDNRDRDGWDEFDETIDAFHHTEDLYPWAAEDGETSFRDRNEDPANFYHAEISHSQGVLSTFLDSNSGEIYHEVQELSLDSLPISETTTETDNGLVLTHNETPSNGPIEIIVNDSESDDPVESATVSIDGIEAGETDDEGTIWLLPPDEEYTVEVEANGGEVELTIP